MENNFPGLGLFLLKGLEKSGKLKIQLFDLFRRTHLFGSISILSPALNKLWAKYTYGHFC